MKKIALVYAGHPIHSTEFIYFIEERLRTMNYDVQTFDLSEAGVDLDPDNDAIIYGGTVAFSRLPARLTDWVRENRDILASRPSALFVVSRDATKDLVREFMDDTGSIPSYCGAFSDAPATERSEWPSMDAFLEGFTSTSPTSAFRTSHAFPFKKNMDAFMPEFEQFWSGSLFVPRSAEVVYAALVNAPAADMHLANLLSRIRTLGRGGEAQTETFLASAEKFGTTPLLKEPAAEVIGGLIGRFWRLDFGVHPVRPEEFASFAEPDYSKVITGFRIENLPAQGGCVLHAEMRIHSTTRDAAFKFRIYWTLMGPGIRLFMWNVLGTMRRYALRPEAIFKAVPQKA